jgi:hypothetical protein
MPPRKNKVRFEDTAEYKKDVVWKIRFTKNDEVISEFSIFGDPKENPLYLEDAIKKFQTEHEVKDWKLKADKYEVFSFWWG